MRQGERCAYVIIVLLLLCGGCLRREIRQISVDTEYIFLNVSYPEITEDKAVFSIRNGLDRSIDISLVLRECPSELSLDVFPASCVIGPGGQQTFEVKLVSRSFSHDSGEAELFVLSRNRTISRISIDYQSKVRCPDSLLLGHIRGFGILDNSAVRYEGTPGWKRALVKGNPVTQPFTYEVACVMALDAGTFVDARKLYGLLTADLTKTQRKETWDESLLAKGFGSLAALLSVFQAAAEVVPPDIAVVEASHRDTTVHQKPGHRWDTRFKLFGTQFGASTDLLWRDGCVVFWAFGHPPELAEKAANLLPASVDSEGTPGVRFVSWSESSDPAGRKVSCRIEITAIAGYVRKPVILSIRRAGLLGEKEVLSREYNLNLSKNESKEIALEFVIRKKGKLRLVVGYEDEVLWKMPDDMRLRVQ